MDWKQLFKKKSKKTITKLDPIEKELIADETVKEVMNEYNKKFGLLTRNTCSKIG